MANKQATPENEDRAVWSSAHKNDLPDEAFAYIEPGGKKDAEGKTTPRTKRHLPYKNADGSLNEAHVKNALARLPQTQISDEAKASAKSKLHAAAKKLGIEVSDNDADNGRATQMPTDTRAVAPAPTLVEHVLTAPITRVDADRRLITVTATSEAVDSYGTIFDYDASKDAFLRWVGNVREMHDRKAVGTRVGMNFDDAARKIECTLRISKGAQDTWEKVLDGTLKGASIGASNVVWERGIARHGSQLPPRAKKYDLTELSLVDNPSNPDAAGITVVRSAQADPAILDELETDEERAVRETQEANETAQLVAQQAEEQRVAQGTAQAEADLAAFLDPATAAADLAAEMRQGTAEATQMTMAGSGTASAAASSASLPGLPPAYQPPQPTRQVSPIPTSMGFNVAPIADALDIALPDPATYLRPLEHLLEARSATPLRPDRVQVARPVLEATVLRREEIAAKERYLADARAQMSQIQVAPFDEQHETYGDYLARVAGVTAAAEARALARWNASFQPLMRRAQGKPARLPGQSLPETQAVQQPVTQRDSGAMMGCPHCGNQMPSSAETCPHCAKSPQAPVEGEKPQPETYQAPTDMGRVAAPDTTRSDVPFDSGEVKTGPIPAPAVPGTEQPGASIGSSHEEHHNVVNVEHEHLAADGVTKMRHTHPHIDANHVHTFRAGQPTDSRLVTAEELRGQTPTDTRLGIHTDTRTAYGTAAPNPPLGALFNFKESGQNQTLTGGGAAGNGSVSPVLSVQPQAVGARVLYNTEDATALLGGVPAAAVERPTPKDDITLDPGAFHEGGHSVAGTPDRETNGGASQAPGAEYDEDGDHDGDAEDTQPAAASPLTPRPTRVPPAAPTVKNSGRPSDGMGQVNTLNPGVRGAAAETTRSVPDTFPATGANEANHGQVDTMSLPHDQSGPGEDDDTGDYAEAEGHDGDADDGATPARPPRPTDIAHDAPATFEAGRDPADTALSVKASGPVPNGGMSAASASAGVAGVAGGLTRSGQRLSAESRANLHEVRDSALDAVRRACAHCNGDGECPECDTLLRVINAGQYGPEGNHLPAGSPDVSNDTAMFGSIRVLGALITRELAERFAQAKAQQDAYFRAHAQALETMYSELRTSIADAQLTLADHQRGASAQVTGALQSSIQSDLQSTHSLLSADLRQMVTTQVEAAMSPLLQRLEALAAVAAETEADVKRMAEQPAPAVMTMMPHSGMNSMNATPGASATADYTALSQATQARHGLVNPAIAAAQDPQTATAVLQAFAQSLPPNDPARWAIAERLTAANRHFLDGRQGVVSNNGNPAR